MDEIQTTPKKRKIWIIVLLLFIIVGTLLIVGSCTLWQTYQQPLGPELATVAPTLIPTFIPVIVPTDTPTETPVISENPVCGETGSWNILILGVDVVTMRGEAGSDLNQLIRVDFDNAKVVSYAFSRNLWVNTSGLELGYPTIEATELGNVFYEAYKGSTQVNTRQRLIEATNTSARMIVWNFSVRTDHYLTVDLSQAPVMIDAIGGIPINIPVRTTDPYIGMVFQPGQQTLTGTQALAYARAIPDSDFGRIDRQKLLLEAMRQRLLDPVIWPKIPELYSQFNQVIATDLSLEQINHLSCLMKEVPKEEIVQEGVRPEWTYPGPDGSLSWDKNTVISHLISLGLVP